MPDEDPQWGPDGPYAYRAFISYSHRDKAFAMKLHRKLESYRIPAKCVGSTTAVGVVPKRLTPIFRDREELPASPDLGGELSRAIRGSMFLIVICSPSANKSKWVEQEILQFKRAHGDRRVLALIVGGTPGAHAIPGKEDEECFPLTLRYLMGPDGELSDTPAEPIAADMRPKADGTRLAQLKLIAGLTGLKLDELVQREAQRRTQRLAMVAAGASAGMVLTGGLAVYANFQRIEAIQQRLIAEKESATAKAASDYLVSTFSQSNPGAKNPKEITALDILGQAAERARTELADQPVVQARLLATLGRANVNLGTLDEGRAVFLPSLAAIQRAGPDGADALLVLAQIYLKRGELDQALAMVKRAEALLGPDPKQHAELRGDAAVTEGRILTSSSKVKEGVAAFDRGLAFYEKAGDVEPRKLAIALNNRGLLLSDDGQYDAAETSLTRSLDLYRKSLGEQHLSTGKAWFALAQNAYNAGKLPLAETRIGNALRIERRVLEADNVILADTLSMQGSIFQDMGKVADAERALREAVSIYRRAFKGRPHYLIGIAEVYLGLIESKRGDTASALATLADAKKNYDGSYGETHPNHGDLLVNRAKVLANAGRMDEAKKDCAAGIQILNQTLGADASFTKSMADACAGLKSGRA